MTRANFANESGNERPKGLRNEPFLALHVRQILRALEIASTDDHNSLYDAGNFFKALRLAISLPSTGTGKLNGVSAKCSFHKMSPSLYVSSSEASFNITHRPTFSYEFVTEDSGGFQRLHKAGLDGSPDYGNSEFDRSVITKSGGLEPFSLPLWKSIRPRNSYKAQYFLENLTKSNSVWRFWLDWYNGYFHGQPLSWELQHEVAQIPDDIWEKGVFRVAHEIKRIQSEYAQTPERPEFVPEVEHKKLIEHVKRLLETPDISALTAESAAANLERAILEFKNTAPANCLPDELEHLERLPALFQSISVTIKSDAFAEAKQERLADQITALNLKVDELEAALKVANEKSLNGRFKIAAIESFGKTIGSTWFLGAMALGTSHFFGLSPNEMTLENLREFADEMLTAEPLEVDQLDQRAETIDI